MRHTHSVVTTRTTGAKGSTKVQRCSNVAIRRCVDAPIMQSLEQGPVATSRLGMLGKFPSLWKISQAGEGMCIYISGLLSHQSVLTKAPFLGAQYFPNSGCCKPGLRKLASYSGKVRLGTPPRHAANSLRYVSGSYLVREIRAAACTRCADSIPIFSFSLRKDTEEVEAVQRRATGVICCMEGLLYETLKSQTCSVEKQDI